MSLFNQQIEALQFHLSAIAPLTSLQQTEKYAHVDEDTVAMMLEQAARFSEEHLVALAARGDEQGCTLQDGDVRLPAGTSDAYRQWCELGFPALSLPMDHEGLDLPGCVQSAVQEVCDGANLAFGMLAINQRCAARTLIAHAEEALVQRWVPGLVSGHIASTIVISEPQAGSDVGRIRTSARPGGTNGAWTLNGGKIWISYGDHDATEQILHLVLARVPEGDAGTRGLGLFAVPKYRNDEITPEQRNGIRVSRLEHKMGLHASPTCVLEFEDAEGWLIGEPGEGIRNLFVMMNAMRQAVAVQGAAIANAATLHALDYAHERPQGGDPEQSPVMIADHADVRRMLLEMTAQAETLRALSLRTAYYQDLADARAGEDAERHRRFADLMLPVAKTLAAEQAFQVANQGIQVLGGYGYTNDYPLERMVRDVRVTSIYEGTSGIQAKDFLLRKVGRDGGATLQSLLQSIDEALGEVGDDNPFKQPLAGMLQTLRQTINTLLPDGKGAEDAEANAYAFLRLAGCVLSGWCALDLYTASDRDSDYQRRLRAALALFARQLPGKCRLWADRCTLDPALAGHPV